MSANKYFSGGTDLSTILEGYQTGLTKASITGFIENGSSSADFADLYWPLSTSGTGPSATNLLTSATDINTIFAAVDTVGFINMTSRAVSGTHTFSSNGTYSTTPTGGSATNWPHEWWYAWPETGIGSDYGIKWHKISGVGTVTYSGDWADNVIRRLDTTRSITKDGGPEVTIEFTFYETDLSTVAYGPVTAYIGGV